MFALIPVIFGCGLVLWLATVLLTARALLRPRRLTPARAMARLGRMSPADIGLRFEACDFEVADSPNSSRLKLAGWWVDAPVKSGRAVLIVHGYGDSRAGALAWVPVWLEVGFNVLVIDLRAHGESDGEYTTAGLFERHDLEQVISEVRARKPESTREFMLFGVSLGGTIALATAERVDGLAGVVIDSPVADLAHGVATQSALLGLPGKFVVQPGIWLAERWLGERFNSIRPAEVIRRLRIPVLAMVPAADPFLPAAHREEIRAAVDFRRATDGRSQVVDFEEAAHLLGAHMDATKYREALNRFVNASKPHGLARASAEGAVAGRSN